MFFLTYPRGPHVGVSARMRVIWSRFFVGHIFYVARQSGARGRQHSARHSDGAALFSDRREPGSPAPGGRESSWGLFSGS